MARKGKISELYDLAALEAQQAKVVALVGEYTELLGKVKPISVKLEGAEKTKEVIDGIKDLNTATAKISEVSGKAVNSMGQLVDMSKKAAGSYEQQQNLITKFSGTLEQNNKLQTQYKIRLEEIGKELKLLSKETNDLAKNSDDYKTKVSALTKEQLELKNATSEIGQTIKAQIKDTQAAENSYDQLNQRLGLLRDSYRQLSEEERNSESGQALLAQIGPLDAKLKEIDGSMGNFHRNVGNYKSVFSGSLATLENALSEVKQKMDDMTKSGDQNEKAMKTLQKEYDLLSGVVENQSAGFVSMRQEIKANETAIEQLIRIRGAEDETVQKLIKENGELRDTYEDLVKTQKTVGSDTFALDAMLQGVQAVAGVFAAAQGAAALFGEENEDLQKVMVKLQAATALVAGITAIKTSLEKEGALIQGIMAVKTGISTVAMRLYAFATAGATAKVRAMNTALLASGFGIALLLISEAASAMDLFSDSTDDATESQEELNKELEQTRKNLEEINKTAEDARHAQAGGLNDLRRELQLLEAKGATDQEIYAKRKEILNKELDDIGVRFYAAKGDIESQILLEQQFKDKKNEIRAEGFKFEKKIADDSLKTAEQRAAKAKELAEAEFKSRFELQKYYAQKQIEIDKADSENQATPLGIRLKAVMSALEKEEAVVNAQRDFDLQGEKVTASQRALIIAKSEDAILELRRAAAVKAIEIRNSIAENDKLLEQQTSEGIQAGLDKESEKRLSFLQGELEDKLRYYEQNALDLNKIELERYTNGEITAEQYQANILKIENEAHRKSILAQIAYYEDLIRLGSLAPDAEKEALQKLHEFRTQLDKEDLDNKKAKKDAEIELEKEKSEKLKELANEVKETVFAFLTAGIERQKNAIQEQIDLLDIQKAKDIEVAQQTIVNAQDRAAAVYLIEKKAQSEKEALERRKRQLDVERARFERAKNIADIIQSTAIAVVSALGAKPWTVANIALAAIVGAIGAAQIVRTLATPLPKYKEGTQDHQGGLAVVGDGGVTEYALTPDGKIHATDDKPTVVDLPKHTKVFKNERALMDAMHNQHMTSTMSLSGRSPNDHYQFQNMTEKLGGKLDRVEKAIKGIPQPIYEGRSNLKGWVHSNGSTTKYIN